MLIIQMLIKQMLIIQMLIIQMLTIRKFSKLKFNLWTSTEVSTNLFKELNQLVWTLKDFMFLFVARAITVDKKSFNVFRYPLKAN